MTDYNNGDEIVTYTLEDAIAAFTSSDTQLSAAVSYGLSDIAADESHEFESAWRKLDSAVRRKIISHLIDVSEANFELNYRTVGLVTLQDDDEIVRERSVDLLWEDETTETLELLSKMAQWDASEKVRAAATGALGRFVLLGEYGKLPERYNTLVQDAALQVWNNMDEEPDVRRRALESISNSSNTAVPDAILDGYNSTMDTMVASSIYAMGRTCDERWAPTILKELTSEYPERRYEAARAAGELELKAAVQTLSKIALTDERDIQEVAIWSLGEIGGDTAMKVLDKMSDYFEEDEVMQELIEDALASASLGSDFELPDMDIFNYLDNEEDMLQ